jgi:hypothetical protein
MGLVIGMVLYKALLHSNQFTHNFFFIIFCFFFYEKPSVLSCLRSCTHNGLANTLDMAEVLTTALDHQKPPVCDLRRQDAQMILTLKIILVIL